MVVDTDEFCTTSHTVTTYSPHVLRRKMPRWIRPAVLT